MKWLNFVLIEKNDIYGICKKKQENYFLINKKICLKPKKKIDDYRFL